MIALLTDFGPDNHYVAQMKARIYAKNYSGPLVDITHSIEPQNIMEAAFILRDSIEAFAAGSIFVVVVDPGVGTDRGILVVQCNRQYFVLPDNGLIDIVSRNFQLERIIQVDVQGYEPSSTFHGRDIMAPIAGELAEGTAAGSLGHEVKSDAILKLDLADPSVSIVEGEKHLQGQVVYSDCFGNLITNVERRNLPDDFRNCQVRIGGRELLGVKNTFADVAEGELLALIGSHGRLEVAVNCGNAREILGVEPSVAVSVYFQGSSGNGMDRPLDGQTK